VLPLVKVTLLHELYGLSIVPFWLDAVFVGSIYIVAPKAVDENIDTNNSTINNKLGRAMRFGWLVGWIAFI
jgi:hypothetical protein